MKRIGASGSVLVLPLLAVTTGVFAQEAQKESAQEESAQEVIVQGSRLPAELQSMPQSVDIVKAEDIQTQLSMTSDMESVLANLIPGLSRSSNSTISTYLSLRGRKPVTLVDGIPVTSTLNDVAREVRLIDPENVQRIEVVRGSSALYGQSAGAGFINYITKSGDPGELNARTEVGTGLTLTHLSGDSFSPSVRQILSGTVDDFDYRVGGFYQKINSLFDANGERLPPPTGNAINDSWTGSGYGKLGYNFDNQRIEGSFNYYKEQSTLKYGILNGNIAKGIATSAIASAPAPGEVPQYNEELTANLVYANSAIFGTSSSFRAQVYYDKTFSIFQYVKNRFPLVVALGQSPNAQSENDTRKHGARIDINTPLSSFLPFDGTLLWGADYLHDHTGIPLVDGRVFGIPQTLESYAGFVELQVKPIERVALTVGVRHEVDKIDVDNFFSLFTLAHITGGELSYSTTPVNAGLVLTLTHNFDLFGGFSQGFDIQQTSQNFRAWPVDINLARTQPPANVINSYESGIRFHGPGIEASATAFLTKSSHGVSYVFNKVTPLEPTAQVAPDHVWGLELKADYTGIDNWRFGASYAQMEGSADTNGDGVYDTWLQDRRIPPASANAYAEWMFATNSSLRLQGLYSGDRNRFPNAAPGVFHQGHVHPYFQTDVAARFSFGKLGDLSVGVNNLLNRDYFTNYSEGFNTNDNYIKAPGATLTVRYGINY
ncbi:MAG: TonB-dependent receptor [Proteobacteria bacterium]|nr:TonB-dependent receptor [Pseudomonadota bacterium]